jgi:hypothetical protein
MIAQKPLTFSRFFMNAIKSAIESFKSLSFDQKKEVVVLTISAVAVTGYIIRSFK